MYRLAESAVNAQEIIPKILEPYNTDLEQGAENVGKADRGVGTHRRHGGASTRIRGSVERMRN